MKKLLLLLWVILLIPIACRHDTENFSNTEEQGKKYFNTFGSEHKPEINYAKGFRYLLERYDSIQLSKKENYVAVSQRYFNEGMKDGKSENSYIDFRFHSNSIKLENGDVFVLFPIIKNNKVNSIIAICLTNERTNIEIKGLALESESYPKIFDAFDKVVNEYNFKKIQAKNYCDFCNGGEIQEVIIDVGAGGGDPIQLTFDPRNNGGGFGFGGGSFNCGEVSDCDYRFLPTDGGGMSGFPSQEDTNTNDPCEKAKTGVSKANTLLLDTRIKNNFTEKLKNIARTTSNSETGISIGKDSRGNIKVSDPITRQGTAGAIPVPPAGYNYYADGHNHETSSPPSAGDLWGMLQIVKDNPTYEVRYVFGKDGSVYALTLNDRQAVIDFLQAHPRDRHLQPGRGDWILDASISPIYADYKDAYGPYLTEGNNQIAENNAAMASLAYIMEKYNMGISLSKSENGGKLQTINSQKNSSDNYTSIKCN